jgi:hypothetical protein
MNRENALKSVCKFFVGSAALAFSLTCPALSQQSSPSADAPSTTETSPAVDPQAHDSALRLVKALELSEKMAAGVDTMLEHGIQDMKAQFPDIRPEFTEEWRKRMKARMKPEDFIGVVVQVYEKHFTADELDQLSNVILSRKEGKPAELPDALKEKFQKNAVAIQSEVIGGAAQLGARLGAEVGEEIGREHPEWAPPSAGKPAQPAK